MAVMGRPPKNPKNKKQKFHVSLDRELYEYLQTVDNRSEWLNKAARSRMNMEIGRQLGKESRNATQGKSIKRPKKTA